MLKTKKAKLFAQMTSCTWSPLPIYTVYSVFMVSTTKKTKMKRQQNVRFEIDENKMSVLEGIFRFSKAIQSPKMKWVSDERALAGE